jgi:uncharacterized protein YggE
MSTRLLLAAALIVAVPAWAQLQTDSPARAGSIVPTIRVTEEAIVNATPDRARLHISVVTQAKNAADAASQNAQRVQRVIAALRGRLGNSARIETANYNLHPDYNYRPEGGQPTLVGYTASNTVRATLDDLTVVGRAIDLAVNAGANQVQQLEFMLRDPNKPQAEALREAARQARSKAQALAEALDMRVVRVVAVEESGTVPPRPYMMAMERDAAQAKTPIEPGSVETRASVTLTVEIAPR